MDLNPETDHRTPALVSHDGKSARLARLKRIQEASAAPRVRVVPADDAMRRLLVHPSGGVGFRSEGSIEWPLDKFTKRRLAEGSITLAEKKAEPESQKARKPESQPSQPTEAQPQTNRAPASASRPGVPEPRPTGQERARSKPTPSPAI